ncbi:MAG TPA: carboxypeptidase-like regulatory domain-containing protein, partial [Paludibacteraceae bacterium]|nr:carboxypeptidase-like regulatory domain-containing protein [Paludibacteraceae bacterium]
MIFLLFLFSLSIGITYAQTRVTGRVIDEVGEPVIGASIKVKGTTVGTISDNNGNFTLIVPENA